MPIKQVGQLSAEGVKFSVQQDILMIHIENEWASAALTTHGGSVLSYTPKEADGKVQQDVLWVSSEAIYTGQKPVRGGIPICWPWFGAHPQNSTLPAHGFVRNLVWQVDRVSNLASGATEVVLTFRSSEKTLAIWPHHFHLSLKVEVGKELTVSLITHNPNAYDIQITEAFHTYFNIKEAKGLEVAGLEGSTHLDKLSHAAAEQQTTPLILLPPIDSVYLNQTEDVTITDTGHQRKIRITKQYAASAVVWNPGPETVKGFSDIPNAAWSDFVCVEAGNIFDNAVIVASGEAHTMTMTLSSQVE